MNYLIIGASAAGLGAAETLRRIDPDGHVTILCREETRPYSRVLLPYLLSGAIREQDIFLPLPEGVELLTGKEVVRADPHRKEVSVSTGQVFPFDRLLVASGASPVRSEVEGADLPFVFTMRELSDVQGMRQWVRKGRRAVIAGGGLVGMRVGEALHRLGMKVTFVVGSDHVLSQILDPAASAIVEQVLMERGIEIIKRDEIVQIAEGRVHLRSGERRECALVVFGKGVRPNVSFLEGSDIQIQRGIIVDEHQETNVAGIYAAGDVAETMDIVYEERRINPLWPVAREQGHVAAMNMASIPAEYEGSVARNTLEVFDLPIFTAGMGREEGLEVLREQGKDFYHKLVLDQGGILRGVIFVGEMRNEGIYLFLVKNRIAVSSFAASLLRNTFGYARFLFRMGSEVRSSTAFLR